MTDPALAPTGILGPFALGAVLAGRYETTALIGEGGMGAVYRVRDRELEEDIALKVLKPELAATEEGLARFRREVRLARRVTHVNVARTYDLGQHEGIRFLTMELITGESVAVADRKQWALGDSLRIAHESCLGLGAAHAVGIVHRDLKPDNVMLAVGRVVLTDFGIARAIGGADAHATMGSIIGTPAYMAPEQVEGKVIDGRTDIYALGVMLFELVTGKLPFHGDTPFTLAAARLVASAPDPRDLSPELPEGVALLIRATLARRREDRPDAATVAHELDRLRGARPGKESSGPALTTDLPRIVTTRTVVLRPFDGDATSVSLAKDLERALTDALATCKDLTLTSARAVPNATGELAIEGEVRASGNKVRARARLVDVARGTTLWAEHVTGTTEDAFALEDAFTGVVVPAITQRVTRLQGPADPALRERFDGVRKRLMGFDANTLRLAIGAAEALLVEAPQDPWILGTLALGLVRLWNLLGCIDPKLIARAEELALRAIDLETSAADAYLAIGLIRVGMCDFRAGLRAVQEALRHNPRLSEAHHAIATVLCDAGRFDEGMRRFELAISLDPTALSPRNYYMLALALLGRKDEVLRALADLQAISGATSSAPAEVRLAVWWHDRERAGVVADRLDAARSGAAWENAIPFLRAYAAAEPFRGTDQGLALLAAPDVGPRRRCMMYEIFAEYYADLGDTERAFVFLGEATKLPFIDVAWLDRCPALASIRPLPRFAEVRASAAARIEDLFR